MRSINSVSRLLVTILISAVLWHGDNELNAEIIGGEAAQTIAGIDASTIDSIQASLRTGDFDLARRLINAALANKDDVNHTEIVLAQILFRSNETASAMHILENFASSNESAFEAHLAFAEIATQQSRLFDAWTHSILAAKSTPPQKWSKDRIKKARLGLMRQMATIASARRDWAQVDALTNLLLKESPNDAEAFAIKANAAFEQKKYEEAESFMRDAVKYQDSIGVNTNSAELMMALLFDKANQTDMSQSWFEKAIVAVDVEMANAAKLRYAKWLISLNKPNESLKVIDTLSEVTMIGGIKVDQEIEFVKGLATRMNGRFQEAEEIFAKLYQSSPSNFVISNQLALVLIEGTENEKRTRALEIATANAQNGGNNVEALTTLGWIQFRMADVVNAERTLTAAFGGGRVSRDAAYYMAQVKKATGLQQDAERLEDAARTTIGEFYNMKALETNDAAEVRTEEQFPSPSSSQEAETGKAGVGGLEPGKDE